MQAIYRFLSHTKWQTEESSQSGAGISWLELFIWLKLYEEKAKRQTGLALLKPDNNVIEMLAQFKTDLRKMAVDGFAEEDEWVVKACRSPANRLKNIAVCTSARPQSVSA